MINIINLKMYIPTKGEVLFKVDRTSPLGNPHYMRDESQRDRVCDLYDSNFSEFIKDNIRLEYLNNILAALRAGHKVALGCHCYPKRCHAETIKAWLENKLKGEVKMSRVLINSGGAEGADKAFGDIGTKYGHLVVHHSFPNHKTKGLGVRAEHSLINLKKNDSVIIKANQSLKRRFPSSNEFVNNLIRRNYYQVINSSVVVAIGTLLNSELVDGGTGWAVQMAKDMKKTIHVFCQKKERWFTSIEGKSFIEADLPKINSKSIAGIGTRELTQSGLNAIEGIIKNIVPNNSFLELEAEAWDVFLDHQAKANLLSRSVLCITTNGFVKNDGACVMGRGIALEAKNKVPGLDYKLGEMIKQYGNRCLRIKTYLWSFPVKHKWDQEADLKLIKKSCIELMQMIDKFEIKTVYLPRPGCGNGKLNWEDVEPVIAPLLDSRVVILRR